MLLATAVGLVSIANIFFTYRAAATPEYLARNVGFALLWIVAVIFLWNRQGWARFLILLLIAWGIETLLLGIFRTLGKAPIWTFAIPMAMVALRLFAAYLMFRPESNAWFKK